MPDNEVFLLVFSVTEDEVSAPIETAISLFLLKYLQQPLQIALSLVLIKNKKFDHQSRLLIKIKEFSYRIVSEENLKHPISDCHLPVFTNNDGISCVAGLCAVLRQVSYYFTFSSIINLIWLMIIAC